jgi:hypothetical protein
MGRHKSRPAIDFANQGIDQIRAIDSRKIVAHRKTAGCKTIRQEAIGRAIRFHCFRINLDNLSWNGRGELVAQIDRIETGKAPHALASFSAKQQSCMNGMSMMAANCAIARSPANVTKIGPSRWLAFTFRSAISFERRTNSGPLALIQLIRTIESSWKQSRICSHKPRSRLRRSRNTNWETAETSAASRTAWGRASIMLSPNGCWGRALPACTRSVRPASRSRRSERKSVQF